MSSFPGLPKSKNYENGSKGFRQGADSTLCLSESIYWRLSQSSKLRCRNLEPVLQSEVSRSLQCFPAGNCGVQTS
ncbi:hypothetical protein CapIbe_022931 [Capra ibex]